MRKSTGFTFKQFHVAHDACAMKVGTDGILLGAWADVQGAARILDIGTGSGLIALMLAQRSAADCQIDAVELDAAAAAQAQSNVAASPWPHKVRVVHRAIQHFCAPAYDLIVSNPPYFVGGQTLGTVARGLARHYVAPAVAPTAALAEASTGVGGLHRRDLLAACQRLLSSSGRACFVLPCALADELIAEAPAYDLTATIYLAVTTRPQKDVNRVLLQLSRRSARCERQELTIHSADGPYSEAYIRLTRDFYLKM
ncbi:MAG: tRNA1(Val) (adenine(37)-N6)-methyltransferase [Aeromonas sp.]